MGAGIGQGGFDPFVAEKLLDRGDPAACIEQLRRAGVQETLGYTYDAIDRLASDNLSGGNTYAYDAQGNLVQKGAATLSYSSPSTHRVTAMGGNAYGYDANGNMVTRTIGEVTYTLGYDSGNRMVSYSGRTVSAGFEYDGDGRR